MSYTPALGEIAIERAARFSIFVTLMLRACATIHCAQLKPHTHRPALAGAQRVGAHFSSLTFDVVGALQWVDLLDDMTLASERAGDVCLRARAHACVCVRVCTLADLRALVRSAWMHVAPCLYWTCSARCATQTCWKT